MSRLAHWAFSPLDFQAHLLLAEGCHPKGVLKARCGHLLHGYHRGVRGGLESPLLGNVNRIAIRHAS